VFESLSELSESEHELLEKRLNCFFHLKSQLSNEKLVTLTRPNFETASQAMVQKHVWVVKNCVNARLQTLVSRTFFVSYLHL
jgi:hypothetical protein